MYIEAEKTQFEKMFYIKKSNSVKVRLLEKLRVFSFLNVKILPKSLLEV